MASAWKLPIVYIIENNLYGISVNASTTVVNVQDLSVRAQSYGIPGVTIDGNDVIAVYENVKQAVGNGQGPATAPL